MSYILTLPPDWQPSDMPPEYIKFIHHNTVINKDTGRADIGVLRVQNDSLVAAPQVGWSWGWRRGKEWSLGNRNYFDMETAMRDCERNYEYSHQLDVILVLSANCFAPSLRNE